MRQLSGTEGQLSRTEGGDAGLEVLASELTTAVSMTSLDKGQPTSATQQEVTTSVHKSVADSLPYSTSSTTLGNAMEQSSASLCTQETEPDSSSTSQSQAVQVTEAMVGEDQVQGVTSQKVDQDQPSEQPATETKPDLHVQADLLHVEEEGIQFSHSPDQSDELSNPQGVEIIHSGHADKSVEPSMHHVVAEGDFDSSSSQSNGNKRKSVQKKSKPLKLSLVSVDDKVVKCRLGTAVGQMINFQFSMEYDKPHEIFQKMVGIHA